LPAIGAGTGSGIVTMPLKDVYLSERFADADFSG